jgi:hypothetical protein
MRSALAVLVLALAALAAGPAQSQAPRPSAEKVAAMQKLAALMGGHWKGTGWWEFRPGTRSTFDSSETVTPRAGGMALEVLGRHTLNREGREVVIHDAFGMLWYDEASRRYRMKAATQAGHVSEFELDVDDTGYRWSHPSFDGKGTIRYRTTLTADTWLERGELSVDGAAWRPVFEMSLRRAN